MANQAFFLDRDGAINRDTGHVCHIESFEFIDGIFDLVREVVSLGLLPIVVTNQAGIAKECRGDRQPERERRGKRGAPIDPPGYDAGKKVKGKKRRLLVDTLGLILAVAVHPADARSRPTELSQKGSGNH